MKNTLFSGLLLAVLFLLSSAASAQTGSSLPPVVANTAPSSGQFGIASRTPYFRSVDRWSFETGSARHATGKYRPYGFKADPAPPGKSFFAIVDATQYNLDGLRFIDAGTTSLSVGFNSGTISAGYSTFVGTNSGQYNTATSNSFFGYNAGASNTTGTGNSFFGTEAGHGNISGAWNSFFGMYAGHSNTTGTGNSFFGEAAGESNISGAANAFFGVHAGGSNTTGDANTFMGENAGVRNIDGNYNAFVGDGAGGGNRSGNSNTAIGRDAGHENEIGHQNTMIGAETGFGTTGHSNAFVGWRAGRYNPGNGSFNSALGANTSIESSGGGVGIFYATAIGAGATVSTSNSIVLGRANGSDAVRIPGAVIIDGSLVVHTMGSAGSTQLCRNSANRISPCSSSLRYKTNIGSFSFGLDLIKRLRPITFDWKDGGMHDLGLGAEDVAAIEPLLVTHNEKGEVEGVKYDRIGVVLINAVKEQQTQIEQQQRQLRQQQLLIDGLKKLVCAQNPDAPICREEQK